MARILILGTLNTGLQNPSSFPGPIWYAELPLYHLHELILGLPCTGANNICLGHGHYARDNWSHICFYMGSSVCVFAFGSFMDSAGILSGSDYVLVFLKNCRFYHAMFQYLSFVRVESF